MDSSTADYKCIAQLAEALTERHEGETVSLHGQTISFSLQSFAHIPMQFIRAAILPKRPAQRQGTKKWPLFSLAPLSYPATVCSISASGTTLTDGTLEMLEHACLVFDNCNSCTLSSITITGGLVVCRGETCKITFNACNFDSCKLVATDGAQISLVNSLIEASTSQIGLLASGDGTCVEAENCIIINGIQSVSAQAGAVISLSDCSCSGASVVGVEARGEGSRIKMHGTFVGEMKGAGQTCSTAPTPRDSTAGTPTSTAGGNYTPQAPLTPGMWTFGGPTDPTTTANTNKPQFTGGSGSGLPPRPASRGSKTARESGSKTSRERTLRTEKNTVPPKTPSSTSKTPTTASPQVRDVRPSTLAPLKRAAGTGASTSRNTPHHRGAKSLGSLPVTPPGYGAGPVVNSPKSSRSNVSDAPSSTWSYKGGSMTGSARSPFHGSAVNAAVGLMHGVGHSSEGSGKPMDEARAACGILVHSGSSAFLENTTVKRCLYGVWIDGAAVRATHSEFTECGGSCMEVKHEGSAALRYCVLSGAMRKHGLGVHGRGASANVKGCKMKNNRESGALVTKGAKLYAESCRTGSNNAGFWAQEDGVLTIKQCLSNRDVAGAGASSGGRMTADSLTAERSMGDGVRVFNAGFVELKNCTLLRCNQDGVWVNGTGSVLRVNACSLRENARFGILAEKGGDVTCEAAKSWGNREGGFGCAARSFMSLRRCISRKETAYEVDPTAKMFFEVCQPSSNKGFFKKRV